MNELITKLECLIKDWNSQDAKLGEEIDQLRSVNNMVDVNHPIQWRQMQRASFSHCANMLGYAIRAYQNRIVVAGVDQSKETFSILKEGISSEA